MTGAPKERAIPAWEGAGKIACGVWSVAFFDIVFDMAAKRIEVLDVPLHLVIILLVATWEPAC